MLSIAQQMSSRHISVGDDAIWAVGAYSARSTDLLDSPSYLSINLSVIAVSMF